MKREIDLAWAAGLFEGEGTWCSTKGRSAQAVLQMRDRDVVQRFAAIVGFGSVAIERRSDRNPLHSDMHRWGVYNAPQVRVLIHMFMPYLGERRSTKAVEILEMTEDIGIEGRSRYAVLAANGMDWN